MGIEIQLLDWAVKEEDWGILVGLLHLRDTYLCCYAPDSVFIIEVLLQGVKVMEISLEPEVDVWKSG